MNHHTIQAARLFVNYFEAIAKKAGMPWQADYTAEIEEAIQHIIEAAVEEARDVVRDDLDNYIKPDAMK